MISVVSDSTGLMPGFLPGQGGTLEIEAGVDNGVIVEAMRATDCERIASSAYDSNVSFLLTIQDGDDNGVSLLPGPAEWVGLSSLPKNGLHCPSG